MPLIATRDEIKTAQACCFAIFLLTGGCFVGVSREASAQDSVSSQDSVSAQDSVSSRVRAEFPLTDFSKTLISFDEIISGGPPRDGIPPIDNPQFVSVSTAGEFLSSREPVISIVIDGEARAYPLQVLIWHEIVNDTLADQPIAVTFCPLCNASIVFDRRVAKSVLDFGTTGRLRNSDLIMYDRQSESWWQQFSGEAIIGRYAGTKLDILPSRLESWERFQTRHPQGQVLKPNFGSRDYGVNPYENYDSSRLPFLYRGTLPEGIPALARVVSLRDRERAWSLEWLRQKKQIILEDGTRIEWSKGQNSALDTRAIRNGKDVGNIVVTRAVNGEQKDIPYFVDFAFAFHAFAPNAPIIHTE